ncbi:MAG: phage tail tape measure protein [Oscillospiraceae bacterium]|nr:phage tail tape measure protein [Oscillospiraceae bacterium]
MAILSATFELIDKMSDKFDKMANSGEKAMDQWEKAGEIGDSAFEDTAKAATQTAKAMDTASQSTDYWTDKIGNYDKSAMEAIYSTEELVEMGYKTADALDQEADAAEEAARASEEYGEGAGEAANSTEMLADAITAAGVVQLLRGIASATAECVENFQEYQTSVAKVSTLADTSVKSIDDISSEIMSLSNDVGQASSDLAEATYQAISAGVDTANSVEFVQQANELAVGGFTSATTAVDVLTTALNAYGLEATEVSQIADYLITTQNLGKTTVDELANSVGKVIPIAAAYGVEMDNLSTAYAVLTANGIATAETGTYLKAMLNELGDSGSAVTAVLINETGMGFAQLTEQGYSLGDVMAILGDSVNNNAGAFNELWSSSEAGIGALSIMNSGAERYNEVLNSMETSTGAASMAFNKMADTSAFAEQKMVNSAKNLQIAIGEDLSGVLDGLYSVGAKIMGGIATVVQKCPVVTAVVVGATAAVAALTIGVTAYTLYTKYATVVTAAFTAAMNANPFILVATAVIGVTAGLAVLISNMDIAENEYNKLTAASKNQYDKIQALNEEYENACEVYGENSQQAKELEGELIMLQNEFEESKLTVEEFEAAMQSTADSIAETAQSYNEAIEQIDAENNSVTALIARLEQLTTADDGAASSQAEILAIVEELNQQFPELNLNYQDVIGNTEATIEALENLAMAEYKKEKSDEAWKAYKDSLGDVVDAQNNVTTATANQAAAQERLNKLLESDRYKEMQAALENLAPSEAAGRNFASTYQDIATQVNNAQAELRDWNDKVDEANNTLDDAISKSEGYRDAFVEASGITVAAKDASDELAGVIADTAYQVQILAQAYEDAYNEALTSFEGQFGLFDQAKADASATVASMQSALDSQLNYWETYASNVSVLKGLSAEDLGVTQENYNTLIEFVQSGTEEAAGLAQSMANAVNSGNTESIAKLAETIGQIQVARQAAAGEVAAWKTDFDNKMDEIVNKMETSMKELDMSTEATTAASNTMKAYAQSVLTNGAMAVANAQSIASQIKAALESANTTISIGVSGGGTTGKGYASGTDFATPGWHLVGENGPEIVEFSGGETVYPADETERMLTNIRPTPLNTNVPESLTGQKTQDVSTKDKRIVVAIEGGGEITVNGNVDKDAVVELLIANLKPALLSVLQEEVFEEGDGSYEY